MGGNFLWRIEAQVPYRVSGAISELLEKSCMAVSYFEDQERLGEWRVQGFTSVEPDRVSLEREILQICYIFRSFSRNSYFHQKSHWHGKAFYCL